MKLKFASLAALAVGLAACGQVAPSINNAQTTINEPSGDFSATNSTTPGGAEQNTSADGVAAQQAAQSGDEGAASADAGAATVSSSTSHLAELLAVTSNANFNLNGCSGNVSASFGNANQTWDYNATVSYTSCTGPVSFSGTEQIVASGSNTNDVLVRQLTVTSAMQEVLPNGDTVTIASLDPNVGWTYNLELVGVARDGNVNSQLGLNEHRVRKTSDGNFVFDHNITTPQDLQVVTEYSITGAVPVPQSRTIVSGTVNVHHNLAHFLASHVFNNVTRQLGGNCVCPSSGTMTQTVTLDDQSGSYVRTYTFTGCGEASVVTSSSTVNGTSNGTATVVWPNCQ